MEYIMDTKHVRSLVALDTYTKSSKDETMRAFHALVMKAETAHLDEQEAAWEQAGTFARRHYCWCSWSKVLGESTRQHAYVTVEDMAYAWTHLC